MCPSGQGLLPQTNTWQKKEICGYQVGQLFKVPDLGPKCPLLCCPQASPCWQVSPSALLAQLPGCWCAHQRRVPGPLLLCPFPLSVCGPPSLLHHLLFPPNARRKAVIGPQGLVCHAGQIPSLLTHSPLYLDGYM